MMTIFLSKGGLKGDMNLKEINQILNTATYIIDSREKDDHIEQYYIKNNIN